MNDFIRNLPDFNGHKLVVNIHDAKTGLYGWIAIHNDALGPAVGGTRMYPYASDADAIKDVLRLSRGMTYKSALAGLKLGGGKAVLAGDPKRDKNDDYLRAYGRRINYLNGAYLTAEDVGFTVKDIEVVSEETPYVVGRSEGWHRDGGGIKGSGDPSPVTANGILHGIRAAHEAVSGSDDISGLRVAILGLGKVGFRLARYLYERGARLIIADIDQHMVERALVEFTGANAVAPEEIHRQEVDVFSPCAMGGIINDRTLPELRCAIVAGAANNQLERPEHGDLLFEKGILYAPDYAINAGGIINVAEELEPGGYDRERALRKVADIYGVLKNIFARSRATNRPTHVVANEIAEGIIRAAEALKQAQRQSRGAL